MSGNTAELPALTGRSLLTLRASHYMASDHADVERRVAIARALVAARPLPEADRAYLVALGRDLYVLQDGQEERGKVDAAAARARATAAYGEPVFAAGPIALFHWSASGSSGREATR